MMLGNGKESISWMIQMLNLIEPDVNVNFGLCPLFGSSLPNGSKPLKGSFGHAIVDGVADFYANFPNGALDVNPPTPPSSLPPSPPIKLPGGLLNGPSQSTDTGRGLLEQQKVQGRPGVYS